MLILILLSISLSLDAFAVAVAHGLKSTRIPIISKFIICFISILYFGFSVWLGKGISSYLRPQTAKIIGILLMSLICLWMLLQVIFGKRENKKTAKKIPKTTLLEFSIKSLGLTFKIIRNPMLSDINHSHTIDPLESILLGTALSIDSISVGIGYSLIGPISLFSPLFVGLFQFTFLCLGNMAGLKFSKLKTQNTDRLQIVSIAIMMILIIARIVN